MFDNVLLYRAHSSFPGGDEMTNLIQKHLFRACAPTEARRVGWSAVCGEVMAYSLQSHSSLSAAAAVKELVEERAAEMEKASGSPLRRAEKQLLKEQVYEELLPTALKRTGHFLMTIDIKRNWILIDAASRKKAEEALDLLRLTLGSL